MGQVGLQYVTRSVVSFNVDSGIYSDFFLFKLAFLLSGVGIFLRNK